MLGHALGVLGLTFDAGARTAIDGHVRLLLAWNRAINLTAITDPAAVARLHVADSLAAVPVLRDARHGALLDLGSGGGFPGIPLAIALPASRVTLLDSVAKKVAFLDAARRGLGLAGRVDAVTGRAEELATGAGSRQGHGPWDVVTARAVGSLADLVELAMPVLAAGGRLVAWKRGGIADELAAAAAAARALGAAAPAVAGVPAGLGLDGHVLVTVVKDRPTPPGYPRDPAARKRRPW